MPPSTPPPPTVLRRRLGTELRRLRENAALSATQAGGRLGISPSQVSNIEAGRQGVSADRVRALAHTYGCPDEPLIDALAAMTGERPHGWWEGYREQLPTSLIELAELEHHATALRVTQVVNVPGLLQTADQARAIFSEAIPPLLPHQIEHRVSHRIKRQAILYRETPPPYTAIIHEAVLHMQFGGPKVAKAQLVQLLEMSERQHITLLAIPFRIGFPSTAMGVDYCHGPVTQLDTVIADIAHESALLDTPSHLTTYRLKLDRMQRAALGPGPTRDLIHRIAQAI